MIYIGRARATGEGTPFAGDSAVLCSANEGCSFRLELGDLPFLVSWFSMFFLRVVFVFLCFYAFFFVFSMFFLVFLRVSVFRQYPGSGSFGGRVWGPRCIFFVYSSTTIWALFAKQQGHQIASTIATCTRTDEEPCIRGPLCSCTDTALFGTLLPAGRSNSGGPPRANR